MNDLALSLEVVSRWSCQPLRHIRHWISRKPFYIDTWTWFQKDHQ